MQRGVATMPANRWAIAMESALGSGTPYAVYGAGKFTNLLLGCLQQLSLPLPALILDDNPQIASLHGIPVCKTSTRVLGGITTVLIGSHCQQDKMKMNLSKALNDDIHIIDLEAEARALLPTDDELEQNKKLRGMMNKHLGKRCFIIGNGPSLRISDLDNLKSEFTFAANRIDLAFEQTDWRPTFYAVIDDYVAMQNREAIAALDIPYKFFPTTLHYVVPQFDDGLYFTHNMAPFYPAAPGFGSDPITTGFFSGSTVTYLFLQLALYMGFKDVFLIGVDFSFSRPHGAAPDSSLMKANEEKNHFHPDYRRPNELWQYPNMDHQRMAYARALEAYNEADASVLNASRSSQLTVFERIDFEDVIYKAT